MSRPLEINHCFGRPLLPSSGRRSGPISTLHRPLGKWQPHPTTRRYSWWVVQSTVTTPAKNRVGPMITMGATGTL